MALGDMVEPVNQVAPSKIETVSSGLVTTTTVSGNPAVPESPFKIDSMDFNWNQRKTQLLAEGQERMQISREDKEKELNYWRKKLQIDLWEIRVDLGQVNMERFAKLHQALTKNELGHMGSTKEEALAKIEGLAND